MIMQKWLISAVALTLALGTAGAVTAFALASDGGSGNADGANTVGEVTHGDPTYEEWLSKYKPTQYPVTSIDDIDPNVCNLVHNINACTPRSWSRASERSPTSPRWRPMAGRSPSWARRCVPWRYPIASICWFL